MNTEQLEQQLNEKIAEAEKMKDAYLKQVEPVSKEAMAIRLKLGPIYAGFNPGDMVQSKPDRLGRVLKARVLEVFSRHNKGYHATALTVRRNGTIGGMIYFTEEHGYRKI